MPPDRNPGPGRRRQRPSPGLFGRPDGSPHRPSPPSSGSSPPRYRNPTQRLLADSTRPVAVHGPPSGGNDARRSRPRSRQIPDDPWQTYYAEGQAIEPPLPPEQLLDLADQNPVHSACIQARCFDAIGRGWKLEPIADATEHPGASGEPTGDQPPDSPPFVDDGPGPTPASGMRPSPNGFRPANRPARPSNRLQLPAGAAPQPSRPRVRGQRLQRIMPRDRRRMARQSRAYSTAGHRNDEQVLRDHLEELTPDISFGELLLQAADEMSKVGWAAWEVVRDEQGHIDALYPVPAHTIRATADENIWVQLRGADIRYFVRFGRRQDTGPILALTGREAQGNHEGRLDVADDDLASELLVFKTYSVRSTHYGKPYWESAIASMAEMSAIREYNISWFSSGGQADRLIHVRAKSADVADQIADSVQRQLDDSEGRGHATVTTAGTEDTEVSVAFLSQRQSQRDGQFMQRRGDLVKEVMMAHGVPPYRIGLAELGSLGGSAAREMLEAYKTGVIEPLQTLLEDRLNQSLFGPDGLDLVDYRWVLEDLDVSETQMDLAIATQGRAGGLLTPNEARKVLGWEPIDEPWADQIGGMPTGTATGGLTSRPFSPEGPQTTGGPAKPERPVPPGEATGPTAATPGAGATKPKVRSATGWVSYREQAVRQAGQNGRRLGRRPGLVPLDVELARLRGAQRSQGTLVIRRDADQRQSPDPGDPDINPDTVAEALARFETTFPEYAGVLDAVVVGPPEDRRVPPRATGEPGDDGVPTARLASGVSGSRSWHRSRPPP